MDQIRSVLQVIIAEGRASYYRFEGRSKKLGISKLRKTASIIGTLVAIMLVFAIARLIS